MEVIAAAALAHELEGHLGQGCSTLIIYNGSRNGRKRECRRLAENINRGEYNIRDINSRIRYRAERIRSLEQAVAHCQSPRRRRSTGTNVDAGDLIRGIIGIGGVVIGNQIFNPRHGNRKPKKRGCRHRKPDGTIGYHC